MTEFWQHRVPLVETRRNMYILTLQGQCQNVKSRIEPSRSYCILISVDASRRVKHIGTIPSALSALNQKLKAKTNLTSYELK